LSAHQTCFARFDYNMHSKFVSLWMSHQDMRKDVRTWDKEFEDLLDRVAHNLTRGKKKSQFFCLAHYSDGMPEGA
jgi:hypothetical protein